MSNVPAGVYIYIGLLMSYSSAHQHNSLTQQDPEPDPIHPWQSALSCFPPSFALLSTYCGLLKVTLPCKLMSVRSVASVSVEHSNHQNSPNGKHALLKSASFTTHTHICTLCFFCISIHPEPRWALCVSSEWHFSRAFL